MLRMWGVAACFFAAAAAWHPWPALPAWAGRAGLIARAAPAVPAVPAVPPAGVGENRHHGDLQGAQLSGAGRPADGDDLPRRRRAVRGRLCAAAVHGAGRGLHPLPGVRRRSAPRPLLPPAGGGAGAAVCSSAARAGLWLFANPACLQRRGAPRPAGPTSPPPPSCRPPPAAAPASRSTTSACRTATGRKTCTPPAPSSTPSACSTPRSWPRWEVVCGYVCVCGGGVGVGGGGGGGGWGGGGVRGPAVGAVTLGVPFSVGCDVCQVSCDAPAVAKPFGGFEAVGGRCCRGSQSPASRFPTRYPPPLVTHNPLTTPAMPPAPPIQTHTLTHTLPPNDGGQVERKSAVRNFEGIAHVADGIIVSRGNLGLDFEPEVRAWGACAAGVRADAGPRPRPSGTVGWPGKTSGCALRLCTACLRPGDPGRRRRPPPCPARRPSRCCRSASSRAATTWASRC
jgi:hypothetical protein